MNPQREVRPRIAAGGVADAGAPTQPSDGIETIEARSALAGGSTPDGAAALAGMLAAILRMTGATYGVVRVAAPDSARLEPLADAGPPEGAGPPGAVGVPGGGAIARWCSHCPESRDPQSDCVRGGICGRDDRFGADLAGWACRHVLAVPLRTRGPATGTMNLWFADVRALARPTMAVIEAAADLVATTLEHDRLAREMLRVSLSSERQMMANEVHDSLAQGLTYMRMRMSLLRDAVREGDHVRAFKYWSDVDISLTHAHRRLRELITYFRSRMDPQGLLHALEETSATFLDRTGVALEFVNTAPPGFDLPVAREVQVFHIVQEALANVCKHANARRARLTLAPRDGGYEVLVEDDGIGMADPAAGDRGEAGHYGMAIMRERARRLGGELTVDSVPGAGTRVRLYFPAVEPQTESGL